MTTFATEKVDRPPSFNNLNGKWIENIIEKAIRYNFKFSFCKINNKDIYICNVISHQDRKIIESGLPRGLTIAFNSDSQVVGKSVFYPKFSNVHQDNSWYYDSNIFHKFSLKYSGFLGNIMLLKVDDEVCYIASSKNNGFQRPYDR